MCNLYHQTTTHDLARQVFPDRPIRIDPSAGNLAPGEVYPDQMAPIITAEGDGLVLRRARWGLPSPPQFHSKSGIDRGVTNVRNTGSPHWRRWLGPEHRCLVPVDRFAEPRPGKGAGNAWFSLKEDGPMFFAGIWVPQWTSMRKLKDGETTDDLFGFLTCEPNAEVAEIHPKAMPVILTENSELTNWMTATWSVSRQLQRSVNDDTLTVE